MKINKLMEDNRKEELKAIYAWIEHASYSEIANIISEIRVVHDNIFTFNADTGLFAKVESVSINGESIQLNIERDRDFPFFNNRDIMKYFRDKIIHDEYTVQDLNEIIEICKEIIEEKNKNTDTQ